MKKVLIIILGIIVGISIIGAIFFYWKNLEEIGKFPQLSPPDISQMQKTKEKTNLIRLTSPKSNEIVQSPFLIKGEARGFWFFEASFPARLLDGNGKEIAVGIVQAQGEWMTEDFVPFEVRLEFQQPATESGMLILEKDNPSGLPEHADELRIPIRFNLVPEATRKPTEGCIKTGCSGQICAEEEVITTCEFLPEYACYKNASCERQTDGSCGWTQTEELNACLQNARFQ